jgi:hypothetical protein
MLGYSRVAAPNLRLAIAGVLLLGYAPASLNPTYDWQLLGCYCWVTLLRHSTQPTIGNCWGVMLGYAPASLHPTYDWQLLGCLLLGYAPASLQPTYDRHSIYNSIHESEAVMTPRLSPIA